jgi:phospholipase C
LIVIVGENHTFDNLYGAYQPKNGQKVSNLLSKQIINQDGTPGPKFSLSAQQQAADYSVD